MAESFSINEANELISRHRALLGTLNRIDGAQGKYRRLAAKELKRLTESGVLSARARDEIFVRGETAGDDPEMGEALRALFLASLSGSLASLSAVLGKERSEISEAIDNLKPATGRIRWFFAGRQKKELALGAYGFLSEKLDSSYDESVEKLKESLDSLERMPESSALESFRHEPLKAWKEAERCVPSLCGGERELSETAELKERLSKADAQLSTACGRADYQQKAVRAAAGRCMEAQLLERLAGIPVDELNRDKAGIRIRLFHENGYDTVADIYRAQQYALEAISGIGEESARLVKQRAAAYASEIRPGLVLRLSANEKKEPELGLIRAIFQYKENRESALRLRKMSAEHRAFADPLLTSMKAYGNEVRWFFTPAEDKKALIAAVSKLRTYLDGEALRAALDLAEEFGRGAPEGADPWEAFERDPIAFFNVIEELVPEILGGGDSDYGLPEDLAEELRGESLSQGKLTCTLRRYQEWGVKYALHQGNVLLGDEMGLGKTVQAIAAMAALAEAGERHFMVVCPASVLTNWLKEIGEKSLLVPVKIHGSAREKAVRQWLAGGGVGVTTYETASLFRLPEDFRFGLLVVDEAHYIKNPEAKRTVSVKEIGRHAGRMLFMTGTALENRVGEMISLIRILNPEIAEELEKSAYLSAAPEFRKKIAPVYYRRRREDVLKELPDLIESREWCPLSDEEERIYEKSLFEKNYPRIRQVSWNVSDTLEGSSKAERLLEIVDEAAEEGRKVIVFSFFLDTLAKIERFLGERCMPRISGAVPPSRRQEIVDHFQEAPAGAVLPAQIVSGGTGLNIQAASVVIICEPQLKPSTENQAISRAYRMGQARSVLVYRLLSPDTVDEKIMDLLDEKQTVFDAFADESESGRESLELDEKTFGDIIAEEIRRIQSEG